MSKDCSLEKLLTQDTRPRAFAWNYPRLLVCMKKCLDLQCPVTCQNEVATGDIEVS